MNVPTRSCLQCRLSKVKCDLARPTCGRCSRRGTICDGYDLEGNFRFRDETARAQVLSRRARGETEEDASNTDDSGLPQAPVSDQPPAGSSRRATRELEAEPLSVAYSIEPHDDALALQSHYHWLNEQGIAVLPAELKQDVEARAVARFFAKWIVYPNRVSPGYMHHLPLLYNNAAPDSILHHAVRAIAFADVRRLNSGSREYETKSLHSYGAAITQLRAVAQEPTNFKDDQTLAALLLIDAFETLYMGENGPLGLHDKALEFALQARGSEQLHSHPRFCLWRISLYRLQARQLLQGKDVSSLQQALFEKLNQDRPDLRVMYHVSKIIRLCSETDLLIDGPEHDASEARITGLLARIANLIDTIETWTSSLDECFKPTTVISDLITRLEQLHTSGSREKEPENLMQTFSCPRMLQHHDITLAFLWSFYAAAQIVLREHTIQLLRYAASHSNQSELSQRYLDRTQGEELAIHGLSASVVRSLPQLMGFDVSTLAGPDPRGEDAQASSLGRFLGVFAMIVVKDAQSTSRQHKLTAKRVLAWMHRQYQLG